MVYISLSDICGKSGFKKGGDHSRGTDLYDYLCNEEFSLRCYILDGYQRRTLTYFPFLLRILPKLNVMDKANATTNSFLTSCFVDKC